MARGSSTEEQPGGSTASAAASALPQNGSSTPHPEQYSHIEINGTDLAYKDIGTGEPIVLVHGSISDLHSFDSLLSNLSHNFRVISYSRRYAWPNSPIADGADDPWDVHANDLGALIEKLDIAPAHVLGLSSGAFIALLLARNKPEMFRSLVLEEPPVVSLFLPSLPPTIGQVLWLLWSKPRDFLPIVLFGANVVGPTTKAFKKGDDELALQIFAKGVFGEEKLKNLTAERWEQMRRNLKPHGALLMGKTGLPKFLEEDARAIKVAKVLILTGGQTVAAHRSINRRLKELIPGAREVVIPGTCHLINEDDPDGVSQAVLKFTAQEEGSDS